MSLLSELDKDDYYFSPEGYVIFTAKYLLKRGYCCQNGCKHCPYGYNIKTGRFNKDENNSSTPEKIMTTEEFKKNVLIGIPEELPAEKKFDLSLNHAPKRKNILTSAEKKLAEQNIKAVAFGTQTIRFVTHLDFTDEMLQKTVDVLTKIS